jgi:hypothetical protein
MAISVDKSNTEKIALLLRTESTTANTGLAKVAGQVLSKNSCGKFKQLWFLS